MIRLDGVAKVLDSRRVVDGVSLAVQPGTIAAVIGPSGGGKTTIARCAVGLEGIDEGVVDVDGIRLVPGLSTWHPVVAEARRRVGMVFQDLRLWPYRTALDNILEGPVVVKRMPRKTALPAVHQLAGLLGLEGLLHKYPGSLSGGERQRVAIARAMAMTPRYLVLDEITSALDPVTAGDVSNVLVALKDRGVGILLVSHQIEFVRRCSDTVYFVAGGRVVEHGAAAEVLARPRTMELERFLNAVKRGW